MTWAIILASLPPLQVTFVDVNEIAKAAGSVILTWTVSIQKLLSITVNTVVPTLTLENEVED
ncbi:MAG: hypothetical protein EBT60_08955 [Bacteroidetes bacterium]|nr:hypothetical protein [Bacteroidota bacterium]